MHYEIQILININTFHDNILLLPNRPQQRPTIKTKRQRQPITNYHTYTYAVA